MVNLQIVSFIGFLIIAVILGGIGIAYVLAKQIMPYHLTAMESSWDDLSPGKQIMSLSFMQCAGGGFLTTSIAIIFLLLFPFKNGEIWSYWALLIISLNELCIVASRVATVRKNTSARPPVLLFIILIAISLFSFFITFLR